MEDEEILIDLESISTSNPELFSQEIDRLGYTKKAALEEMEASHISILESTRSEYEQKLATYERKMALIGEGFKMSQVDVLTPLLDQYESLEVGIADLKERFADSIVKGSPKKYVIAPKITKPDYASMTNEEIRNLLPEQIRECPAHLIKRAWN